MAGKSAPTPIQIRTWVRQGRTDAWVAHQLEVSVRDIEQFKRQNELVGDGEPAEGALAADYSGEVDLRAEDDALIAAELEAAEAQAELEHDARADAEHGDDGRTMRTGRRMGRPRPPAAAAGAQAAGAALPGAARARWRARSTTARRATACGSTPRSRTTRSTPSTGPATGPSR